MIAYELVYPESDLKALTDFIFSKQEGNRETLRSTYPRDYFKGKRLIPELFDSIESTSQARLPENFYYVERMFDGELRGQSKLTSRNQLNSDLISEVKAERPFGLMEMKFITVMTKLPNPLILIRSLN